MHDRRLIPLVLLLAATVLLLPVASHAQSFNGYVSGTVLDPSGSPVPDVALVLKNTGTGFELRRTLRSRRRLRLPQPRARHLRAHRASSRDSSPTLRRGIAGGPERQRAPRRRPGASAARPRQIEVVGASAMNYDSGSHEDGIAPETLYGPAAGLQLRPPLVGHVRPAHARRLVRRQRERLRRAHQRRPAVGRRGGPRRRLHAAGLHEPERHGLDLPGLPLLAGHGERDQGRQLELRRPVRLDHRRPDRRRHEVGPGEPPRRALLVRPAGQVERQPVGRHGEVAPREEQLRRRARRPDEGPRPVVELGQDLLLRRRRGLPPDGRLEPADAVHPLDDGEERRLQRLA